MNNTLELVKISIRENLDFRSMKKEKTKTITFGAFILSMGTIFIFLSVVYNLMFGYMFKDFNKEIIYSTIVMVGFASMLILTTSVARVKSIFIGSDYDMLASMPLNKREIIASKIIGFYLTELLFSAIVMIPNIVINVMLWNDFTFILVGLIIMILLPAIPVVVSCFIGTIIALFAEKSKFGNIITTLLYTVFFVIIMSFSFNMNINSGTDSDVILGMTKLFKMLNPTAILLELAYTKSFLWFIAFCIINLLILVGITLFLSLSYDSLHVAINASKSNIKYERKKLDNKGLFKALLGLEFKRLFNSKLYFMNSCIGGILVIIMSFSLGASAKDLITELGDIKDFYHLVVLLSMFILGINTPTSCSINMEGKYFWLTKSLPIDYKVYVKAKIATSVIILGVCSLVSSIIFIVFLNPNIIQAIAIVILPLLFVIVISSCDLLINLFFVKLNWKNEQEAVKNSASVMISILAGFVLTIIVGLILVVLTLINTIISIIVTTIVLGLLSLALYYFNTKIVENRIEIIE